MASELVHSLVLILLCRWYIYPKLLAQLARRGCIFLWHVFHFLPLCNWNPGRCQHLWWLEGNSKHSDWMYRNVFFQVPMQWGNCKYEASICISNNSVGLFFGFVLTRRYLKSLHGNSVLVTFCTKHATCFECGFQLNRFLVSTYYLALFSLHFPRRILLYPFPREHCRQYFGQHFPTS